MDAKEANLAAKQLDHLFLSWGRNGASELQENVEQILEALEPDSQLKDLEIVGYKGKYFSNWMSNPSFKDLCSIKLIDCTDCLRLPALGKLPSLKTLSIHCMNHVQFIDDESYDGGRITRGFKSLQSLTITNLPNLAGLSKEECRDMFPSLSVMEIGQCSKLVLPHLPSVTELAIDEYSENFWDSTNRIAPLSLPSSIEPSTKSLFMCSINSLHGLQDLWLRNDEELTSLPDGMLQDLDCLKELRIFNYSKLEALQRLEGLHSLQTLQIHDCAELKRLSTGLQYLTSLKNLTITDCREVEDLAEALQHVAASLQYLNIGSLPKLEPRPDWLGNLTSVQYLTVFVCENLMFLPMSIKNLSSLRTLEIYGCPELTRRCEKEIGKDWHKVFSEKHGFCARKFRLINTNCIEKSDPSCSSAVTKLEPKDSADEHALPLPN